MYAYCCWGEIPGVTGDVADEYEDTDLSQADALSAIDNSDFEVAELPNGKFRCKMRVASAFFAAVIGKKGASKKRIEIETKTRVDIPRQGSDGPITITGPTRSSVLSACGRIQVIVDSSRRKHEFTHFVSIPIKIPDEDLTRFKASVLEECGTSRGVDESIFQDPKLLHLTVVTMANLDASERETASDVLRDCKEKICLPLFGERALRVRIRGLEIMNDDPAEVDVLYAKVTDEDSGVVQELCDRVAEKFAECGVTVGKRYDSVKLHVTLMNTLFRSDSAGIGDNENSSSGVGSNGRESMDATEILGKFQDYDFGAVEIDELHLSQRRAARRTKDGYYWPTATMSLHSCG